MTDRSPIAALAQSWRETARGHMSMAGNDRASAHINMAIECDQKAAELEAAIAAQVEVFEASKRPAVNNILAARNLTIEGCIRKLKGEP